MRLRLLCRPGRCPDHPDPTNGACWPRRLRSRCGREPGSGGQEQAQCPVHLHRRPQRLGGCVGGTSPRPDAQPRPPRSPRLALRKRPLRCTLLQPFPNGHAHRCPPLPEWRVRQQPALASPAAGCGHPAPALPPERMDHPGLRKAVSCQRQQGLGCLRARAVLSPQRRWGHPSEEKGRESRGWASVWAEPFWARRSALRRAGGRPGREVAPKEARPARVRRVWVLQPPPPLGGAPALL